MYTFKYLMACFFLLKCHKNAILYKSLRGNCEKINSLMYILVVNPFHCENGTLILITLLLPAY